ncbi:MAG: alpha/beta hydrolase [Pseudomonadota bacterium]
MSKDAKVENRTSEAGERDLDSSAQSDPRSRLSTRSKVIGIVVGILSMFVLYFVVVFVYCKLNPLECLDTAGRRALEKQGLVPRMVTAEDTTLRVWDSGGQGRPMVLLHGQLMSSTMYCRRSFLQALRKTGYRVLLVDLPSHGESQKLEGDPTPGKLRDVLAAFLEQEKLERPVLIGHGLGGWVAGLLALERPELVDRLVLIEPDGIAPAGPDDLPTVPTSRKQWRAVLRKANPRNRERTLGDGTLDALLERSRSIGLAGLYEAAQPGDFLAGGRLASLKVPTALIWGEENLLSPPSVGKALAAELPGARFRSVPKAGQAPFLARPASTALVIIEVLAALDRAAAEPGADPGTEVDAAGTEVAR